MAKLLYIEVSPRDDRSTSTQVAKEFLSRYEKHHSSDTVEHLNLWTASLPRFEGPALNAKYAILHGQSHTQEQKDAWNAVEKVIAHFKEADKYLFSLPMWNFGIPYILKHYIDVLVQPGYTFSYTPAEGYKGLVTAKKALAIYSRGGAYGPGTGAEAYDLQSRYLEVILGFIGITDLRRIVIEPTLADPDSVGSVLEKARNEAAQLATSF
jgi:FMN-dependent NADH-azoreductase